MPAGRGLAVMTIDASALAGAGSSEPQTFTFTFSGNTLTFTVPPSEGTTGTMTGTVSRRDRPLSSRGDDISGQGVTMNATWQVTKQIVM